MKTTKHVHTYLDTQIHRQKKKKGHKFKREQGGLLYGQVYWDKREEKNSVIIISKMKKNF